VSMPLSTLAVASTPRALAAAVVVARSGGGARGHGADAPQHEWERILTVLWREHLSVSHVARTDSFFALGGRDDQAVAMLGEVRDLYGVDVALGEFRQTPTIEGLARQVGRRSHHDVLVPLTTTGTGPPLFLVAGAGGLAITFLALARLLGPDQPCYGLQAKGIERRAAPDLTIKQGARRYARAIVEVQPDGPYLIGGHSLGGVHALKVAQELDRQGREVALLVIFDTPVSPSMVGRRAARETSTGVVGHGAWPRGLPKASTLLHLPVVGIVPQQGTDQFEAFAALGELQALLARRLRPWAGPTTLFLSDEDEAPQIEARWGRILTGAWTSAQVPGGHIAMLEPANIGVAAAILRDQIDRALGRDQVGAGPHAAPPTRAVGEPARH
jgi:thioesterase domain-containing protein